MFEFYSKLSATQRVTGGLWGALTALTRLNRAQIRVFSAENDWNSWAV